MNKQAPPKGYVDTSYLAKAAQLLAPIKKRSYGLMQIQAGQTLLDVGCGPGIDTVAMGQITGPRGKVFGVDSDDEMIAEAEKRAQSTQVDGFVTHTIAGAHSLPFDSDSIDGCRSERLFMHLSHPEHAMREMVRITKPGGWIVVVDTDWGTASINSTETETERRLMRFRAEQLMHNGYSGRRLYGLFQQCGLTALSLEVLPLFTTDYALDRFIERLDEVEEKAVEAGVITHDALDRWRASLELMDQTGAFFASANLVMVSGRKP